FSLALDDSGSVLTTGLFSGTVDFDPGPGTAEMTEDEHSAVFISKLSGSGEYIWARELEVVDGVGQAVSLATDRDGNVLTAGWFQGTIDFDPGTNAFSLTTVGSRDIFVSKLDSSGSFVWAKHLGGGQEEVAESLGVDGDGNVIVTGQFRGALDFDPGPGTALLTAYGDIDSYVLKLDASGDHVWARQLGGGSVLESRFIAVDANGNSYITGAFNGTADFDPGAGVSNLVAIGDYDIFVAKLDESGGYVWARQMGGASTEWGECAAVDASGNVLVAAYFVATVDFDPGAGTFNLTSESRNDICTVKLDDSGIFQWAKQVRCSGYARAISLAVDNSSGVYTSGFFDGTMEFDLVSGTGSLTSTPPLDVSFTDIFVIKQSGPPVPPEVASVVRAGSESTNADAVDFTVNFDQGVTGVDTSDFGLTTTGVVGASVVSVTGSGGAYTVNVSTGTGDGTLRLDVVDDDTIVNADTLPLGGAGSGNGTFSAGEVYTIDRTAPSAASSSTASALTNVSPIPVAVTFSEPVIGFTSSDVTAANASVTNFAGSGDTYTFGLLPAGQGVVTASIAGGVCADAAGNLNEAAETLSRTFDSVKPEVNITGAETSPTNSDPISMTLAFNRDMTGFSSEDVAVTNGTLSNFESVSAALYTVDVHPSGQGEVRLDIAAGAANSVAGNPNLASWYEIVYDSQPPVITVLGENPAKVHRGETYIDAGATAYDLNDGDLSATLVANASAVDTSVLGVYQVTYAVSDAAGNAAAQATRDVEVLPEGAQLPLNPLFVFLALLFAGTARLGLSRLKCQQPPHSRRL
ncbi:MAG: DUF5011 domain-containing protein, partial [Candidatus Hydrogenedentes bacterium]|nr:DUF5011 domain-containing protein [Candidatus Hydrogenedentota bacterium]